MDTDKYVEFVDMEIRAYITREKSVLQYPLMPSRRNFRNLKKAEKRLSKLIQGIDETILSLY